MDLYHGTSSKRIAGILQDGLRAPNHWGTREIAEFFAERECKINGGKPTLIRIPLNDLEAALLAPDEQMLEFPLTDILGEDHGMLEERWDESKQGWRECLDIYQSLVFSRTVSVTPDMLVGAVPVPTPK